MHESFMDGVNLYARMVVISILEYAFGELVTQILNMAILFKKSDFLKLIDL